MQREDIRVTEPSRWLHTVVNSAKGALDDESESTNSGLKLGDPSENLNE